MPRQEESFNLSIPPIQPELEKGEGKRENKAGMAWTRKQGWGNSGKYSPAQVAIHGFHIIVLAACKGAQLVEGHSWGERKVTQPVATTFTQSCQAQPKLRLENSGGGRVGSAGVQVMSSLILFLQGIIDYRLSSH